MKLKLLASFAIAFLLVKNTSAQVAAPKAPERYIEVTGSAETSVKPDEVDLSFRIREYLKKGTKEKVDLLTVQNSFLAVLKKYGITEENVKLANSGTYGVDWYSFERNKNVDLQYKRLSVTIDSNVNLGLLMNDLSKDWMDDISIEKLRNKNEQKLRKDIKIMAIKSAKEKATYLCQALGEEPGRPISIEETDQSGNIYAPISQSITSNSSLMSSADNSAISNTGDIRIRYEIKVRFEIK